MLLLLHYYSTGDQLCPLVECRFCTPAKFAPVERIFSLSGLMMRSHRARMSDSLLETLVYLKGKVCVFWRTDRQTFASVN